MWSNRQTGRQADRQTGRQADRQTGRQADRQTGRQADRQTGIQAGCWDCCFAVGMGRNPAGPWLLDWAGLGWTGLARWLAGSLTVLLVGWIFSVSI